VAVTAAAQLAPLADFADLDGHLLVRDDPFEGLRLSRGQLQLPEGPGLGLRPAPGVTPPLP
jgi:L-alanine-DL-glutamate epimerase-like enolase superfamily enzyme